MPVRHELLAAAIVATDDAVVMTDAHGLIADLNPAAERLFGARASVLGQSLDRVVRFQREPPALDHGVAASAEPASVDVLPPGGPRALPGTLRPVHAPDGAYLGRVLVVETQPDPDTRSWHRLVAGSGALFCVAGFDGYFKELEGRWTELLGHPVDELLAHPLGAFVHPDDIQRTALEIERVMARNDRTTAFENRYRHAQGGYRWLSWHAVIDPDRQRTYAYANDVSDVKRQERIMHETQWAARVGGWELDLPSRSIYWTDETYRIHDTTPAEYTPTRETALSFYRGDSALRMARAVKRAAQQGEPFDLEIEMVTATGRHLWCRNIGLVDVDEGKVRRVYGSCQDITEQRQTREALRASERQLRALVRDIGIGVLVQGPGAEILQCNQTALDALGLTEDQLLGRTSFDPEWNVIREDGKPFPGDELPVPRAIATGRSVTGVIMGVYRPRTQDRVWLLVNAMVQPDQSGNVQSVICSFADITARKRAEDAARASNAMFQAVYDNAGLAVLLREPAGQLLSCNRAFTRMVRRSTDTLRTLPSARYVHPEDMDLSAQMHADLLAGRREAYEVERRYVRADGEIVWGHVTVSAVREPDGRTRYLVEMVMDITDRKRMEAQLMLADRLASLGTMAAGMAHEINNPLTWLMGNISYVLETMDELRADMTVDDDTFDDLHKSLADSLSGADRIRTIVQDLKLFSRTKEQADASVDITRVLHSTLRMLHNELSHRAELALDVAPVPAVAGDEARLGQVLTNLLVNAIQALPDERHHDNRILVRVASEDDNVLVEVSDNGAGIAPEVRARIFDPFFTTKRVGQGTGLGLSICHSIVTSLGGRIEVDSEPGVGTTFRVHLRSAEPAGSAVPQTAPQPAETPSHARKRILCIDDEPDMGDTFVRMLGRQHDVTFETDGTRAIDRLRAGERYDAIICDIMMPSMNAMELYRALREIAPELTERCGFVTGGTFTPAARAFVEALPRSRLLEKPFARDTVSAFVQRLVR
ncbi:MAG TPA: PAS domain S-box protein [Haliangium sp.]|nr:PAS domain S-box protein [Haliangium sp.]